MRSLRSDAVPLMLVPDWPGSFVLFRSVVESLARDFHLVIPNLPGVAFSGPLTGPGWHTARILYWFTGTAGSSAGRHAGDLVRRPVAPATLAPRPWHRPTLVDVTGWTARRPAGW